MRERGFKLPTAMKDIDWKFIIKLLITILSAIAGAMGASAMGVPENYAAATGFVTGNLVNCIRIFPSATQLPIV